MALRGEKFAMSRTFVKEQIRLTKVLVLEAPSAQ